MYTQNTKYEKCVLIMDEALPLGVIANTAAILGVTIGRCAPQMVGKDVVDGDKKTHIGIVEFPIPILKGSRDFLAKLREKLYLPDYADVTTVDFSELAQGCRVYEEYMEKMAQTPGESLRYLGLALCGTKKAVNKLTGSLPLLR